VKEHQPFALKNPLEVARRVELLEHPHMLPLKNFVEVLRLERGPQYLIPHFDSLDGGFEARVLFLLEAPGPKVLETGFISRDNPDLTARNIGELLEGVGLARADTLLWNTVPWYISSEDGRFRAPKTQDIMDARAATEQLLTLLSKLEHIVLVGNHAQKSKPWLETLGRYTLWAMGHPSPRNFGSRPQAREVAREMLERLANVLNIHSRPS